MALQTQSPSLHNMFRQQCAGPATQTKRGNLNFEPPAKRLKTDEAEDSGTDEDARRRQYSPQKLVQQQVIADSDAESNDEELEGEQSISTQRTDLEQALPPVSTDRQAIEQYETMRAAQAASSQGSSGEGARFKSSIYVDAFFLALDTVLEEESHLFNDAEKEVFERFRNLDYEAQYLYVRLFLRKTSAWHRIHRLRYHSDIADMEKAIRELFRVSNLPDQSKEDTVSPGELVPPKGTVLEGRFTFADNSEEHISTLEEASSLLFLDELKAIGKEAKVQGKNKSELLKALRRTSGKQTSLSFASNPRRSDTGESDHQKEFEKRSESPQKVDQVPENRDAYFRSKILASTGPCIRLSEATRTLFERVHLVFYRSTEWTEKSLTTIILARIARRNFPQYIVSRSANIFPSRSLLLEFEASLRTQFRVDSILEFNGTPSKENLQLILDIFDEVYPRWKILLAEEQRKENSIYSTGEGAYLRRLSPAWVYTRIVHKGAYVLGLGKFKNHLREHEVLSTLLCQRLFHAARRGAWYQRKALLEEHYMHALQPAEDRAPDAQKRHWKQIALHTCEQGLQDNLVHLIYHYDLQKRITKLEKQLKVPARAQHDFAHTRLAKPIERTFTGIQIEKPPPRRRAQPPSLHRAASTSSNPTHTHPGKTIWLDPAPSFPASSQPTPPQHVSVESMILSHYRSLGWKGYHTESGIIRTLFALLFHDILFLYLPNVFQTPFQTCPLDLHTDAFYPARMGEIEARLAQIANGAAGELVQAAYDVLDAPLENERARGALEQIGRKTCVVGLDWTFAPSDVLEIAQCVPPAALVVVCRVLCEEYAQRGGGMPDLFLWRRGSAADDDNDDDDDGRLGTEAEGKARAGEERGECAFVEVKSVNDRLSDTQRLWIHVLSGAGVRVEVARAVASEVRRA